MFGTITTLLRGRAAQQEEALRDRYAIELIDQKIREAETQQKAAKASLAALIGRERGERRQLDQLEARIADLTDRARQALDSDRQDLAQEAATAIAELENEATARRDTLRMMEARVLRLRQAVEATHRRLIDLRQGARSARALRREQQAQIRLRGTISTGPAIDEAEALIARVLDRDDPAEQVDILREIETGLDHTDLPDRMAAEGFGPGTRVTPADVLARLKTQD